MKQNHIFHYVPSSNENNEILFTNSLSSIFTIIKFTSSASDLLWGNINNIIKVLKQSKCKDNSAYRVIFFHKLETCNFLLSLYICLFLFYFISRRGGGPTDRVILKCLFFNSVFSMLSLFHTIFDVTF